MPASRQLAAIMFTDIVGYTALMGSDEQKAFQLLKKNRQIQQPLVNEYNGKWIKELGDGVLASFQTVTDAVFCATAIHSACNAVDSLKLRIGIHLGEVVFENNDVFGDGVNIASRLQALAPAGGTWVSESVQLNVANKKDIQAKFIKEETLKNVKEPVKIYEIAATLTAPSPGSAMKEQSKSQFEKSIAVLPFVNMSNDPEQEYFSDGITEEILNSLAHLKELKVAGRTSSFQFKGKNIDLREVGNKLGVNSVLEGSVRKHANRLRITAQLINVADGFHLWSERYDRDIDDIFAIQDEIAMAITEKLKVTLLENDRELIGKIHTQNADAHSFYLKGRYEWNKRTQEGFLKSIDYFNQAIAEDQQYSLAYAGMADSYTLLCGYHILSPAASIPTAKYAAEKAMELNPMLAEAYEAVGHIELLSGFDWKKAEDNYSRAIELNPGFATARQRYALMLAIQGRFDEAFEAIMKAQELDPLSKIINTDVALVHLLMGNTGKCIEKCRQVLATDAAFPVALFIQGIGYQQSGKTELAVANFQRGVKASNNNPIARSALGCALALSGNKPEALTVLQELENISGDQFVSPYCIAVIYAGLGMADEVFAYLNKAVDIKSAWMIHLHFGVDPRFTGFKNDIRYTELLKRIEMDIE
ncbi:MAG: adenylate/guanylate cyclase domain-containing protein [Bacteroidota bacterium]